MDEPPNAGYFYCPYVPLTSTPVVFNKIKPQTIKNSTSMDIRSIVSSSMVKDMMAHEDERFIRELQSIGCCDQPMPSNEVTIFEE